MSVVGNNIAFLAHHAEQNAFRRSPLVRGNHVTVAEDVLDRIAKVVEAAAPGVAFITLDQRRPLVG